MSSVDNPVGALLCSIFIGPLGLQGWLIDPANHGNIGKYQRFMSYVLILILVVTAVIMLALYKKKANFKKKQSLCDNSNAVSCKSNSACEFKDQKCTKLEKDSDIESWKTAKNVTHVAMSACCFVSLIFAIIIVSKADR